MRSDRQLGRSGRCPDKPMSNRLNTARQSVDIRRANERFVTQAGWLDSKHSFSFGHHHDAENINHGLLLVSNDDIIRPGTGFSTHPHRDMEIVTWVLTGSLEHKDSQGNSGIIYPGLAQRMSAGTGILHSEMNPSDNESVRLVQMWVFPDTLRVKPGYEQLDINRELEKGGLVPVASGRGHDAAISIRQKGAVLWAGRIKPGEALTLPDAKSSHLFIARGAANLEAAGRLDEGDAVRLTAAGARRMVADAQQGAEVLVWEMN